MNDLVRLLRDDESGATMVEYAIMVSLIAAVCIFAVTTLGSKTSSEFTSVNVEM